MKENYREEYVRLLRMQQQRQRQHESDSEQLKAQLGYKHLKELEALGSDVSFIKQALVMRRHYMVVQNLKRQEKREHMEMVHKHSLEIKQLKSMWEDVDQNQLS
ncbi:hypothetical protein [Dyadobacter fanqingshengii]|uniref:Uncharacterized protein n=1 Tax=Dyadobacter fanqingshengii TaxID=2906443 RepID=A0A9X1P9E2_9BACT|nr:hypothetical protein [Dyadobacter fanqingshengii]MCF0040450.1 hypothetical protein [Dyadobacter fanqingshengii]MCF2501948.1 hypothetical protein [Dyadobacter fanqingshengii]USJ37808.1 hypothetical protein NFI81_08480 [Dyadobacter fanqingshengii]